MLRKIRITLGVLTGLLVTLLFLDFTGAAHAWLGWLAKIQLVPAVLKSNFLIAGALILVTLLFGRVYCSVICPLGIFQDAVSRTAGRGGKKKRFSYTPAKSWLRYGMLGFFVLALFAGFGWLAGLVEPYSAYGRIASNLFAPVYRSGNNLLAWLAERAGSYAFYSTDVWIKGGLTFAVAVVTFAAVGFLAWRNGRSYCNTLCPVGTLLGMVSGYSLFRPEIDPEKCTKCSLCSRSCKASCIDYKNYSIDHSRCVACMNCLDRCKFDALHYTAARPVGKKAAGSPAKSGRNEAVEGGMSRRGFLSVAGLFAANRIVNAQHKVADGGLAVIEDKKIPARAVSVVPPGSQGARNMKTHCTGCQLCVSACPNDILRPSERLSTFMQPEMSFERGYCRPECTRCSEVCPAGAIRRITTEEKSSIQIGRAVWIADNCVVNRDEVQCTACFRHCPTGAIELVSRAADENDGLKIPLVRTELCIGCGACENLCPSRPLSAIYVEGNEMHRQI